MVLGRGRGKKMRDHQSSTRNNLRSRQDLLSIAGKNLDRQRGLIGSEPESPIDRELESPILNQNHLQHVSSGSQQMQDNEQKDGESECVVRSRGVCLLGKRKKMNNLYERVAVGLQVNEASNPPPREENINCDVDVEDQTGNPNDGGLTQSAVNGSGTTNAEATSKTKGRGCRGMYKSYVVDMKIKGKGSKLTIEIPDEIDRAIGENARHLVNECGRVVRTRAPLNVDNWQQAFSAAGDGMWKEIQDKFHIVESRRHWKLYAFVVETMQRLYRLWKSRLHYYYKSVNCGKTDAERLKNPPPDVSQDQWAKCVKRFGSKEFKAKENNNVKPSADVVWLVEHTTKDPDGNLRWADPSRSKEIHGKLKDVVAASGDSMTQEQILVDVLGARSGYIRGKGTAVHGYTKGIKQLAQQKIVEQQQEQLQEQQQKIHDLEKMMEEYKAEQQRSMEAFKEELLQTLSNKSV